MIDWNTRDTTVACVINRARHSYCIISFETRAVSEVVVRWNPSREVVMDMTELARHKFTYYDNLVLGTWIRFVPPWSWQAYGPADRELDEYFPENNFGYHPSFVSEDPEDNQTNAPLSQYGCGSTASPTSIKTTSPAPNLSGASAGEDRPSRLDLGPSDNQENEPPPPGYPAGGSTPSSESSSTTVPYTPDEGPTLPGDDPGFPLCGSWPWANLLEEELAELESDLSTPPAQHAAKVRRLK